MRSFLFLSLLSIFYACNSTKESIQIEKNIDQIDSTKILLIQDTTQEVKTDNILAVDYIRVKESQQIEKVKSVKEVQQKKVKTNKQNVKIEDKTTTNTVNLEQEVGTMAYSVPEEMVVGKTYPVKLRISRDGNKLQLIDGDRNITIYDSTIKSKVIIESIRVESIMSAQLIGDSDKFEITSLSTELQNIEKKGYTEWSWKIKPIKGGQSYLKLIVKVRVKEDGQEFYKDITVFDKNVDVKSNIGFTLGNFIKQYWQWLLTTIIIPLVVWWWKNRKEKKKSTRKKNV